MQMLSFSFLLPSARFFCANHYSGAHTDYGKVYEPQADYWLINLFCGLIHCVLLHDRFGDIGQSG